MRRPRIYKKVHTAKDGTEMRSGFEVAVYNDAVSRLGVTGKIGYETLKIPYDTQHVYTPDLALPSGVIIEIKGRFTGTDRAKHARIRKIHGAAYDIRFVFQRANITISKVSTTTYGEWATKHGFLWCEKVVPWEWLV